MNKYELMIVVDAQKTQEQKETIYKQTVEAVEKTGGKVNNCQVWLDKHKFPFKMKRCIEGTYYLIRLEGPSTLSAQARQILRLNDDILRYIIVNIDE